jgi:DNA-directed RNA polymerase specialized sigma24 family protein
MDPVLLPYLRATSDSEREVHLDELILVRAAPLVRRILRHRLGLHVSDQGTNRDNHEAEDLYQETITKIVQTVRSLESSSRATDIGDFRGYVASITNNACVDFLRVKSPAKYRLKHGIRDVFNRHQDFRTWKADDEIVGGFAVWYGTDRRPASARQVRDFENDLETFRTDRFANEDLQRLPLTRIVAEVLQWFDRPVSIDDLANIVSLLLKVQGRAAETVSFDENLIQESGLRATTRWSNVAAPTSCATCSHTCRSICRTRRRR